MLTALFVILMIATFFKLGVFAVKGAWGILKLLLVFVLLPIVLIKLAIAGFIYIILPLLVIGWIVKFVMGQRA